MKKNLKMLLSAIVILSTLLLVSCGSKQLSKITLNEDLDYIVDVLAWGDEEDFFEPVQGTYSLMKNDDRMEITIEFVKTKKNNSSKYTVESFSLIPEDSDEHSIMIDGKEVEFQALDRQKKADELFNAAVGDKVKVTFTYIPKDKDAQTKIIENFVTCSVELDIEEVEDENENEEIVSSNGEADVDALLNELEAMLNRLASMDDLSEEYDEVEDQIMNLMDKIEGLDMSSAQESRYDKLDDKFDRI